MAEQSQTDVPEIQLIYDLYIHLKSIYNYQNTIFGESLKKKGISVCLKAKWHGIKLQTRRIFMGNGMKLCLGGWILHILMNRLASVSITPTLHW